MQTSRQEIVSEFQRIMMTVSFLKGSVIGSAAYSSGRRGIVPTAAAAASTLQVPHEFSVEEVAARGPSEGGVCTYKKCHILGPAMMKESMDVDGDSSENIAKNQDSIIESPPRLKIFANLNPKSELKIVSIPKTF
jgi:hypothetical protein